MDTSGRTVLKTDGMFGGTRTQFDQNELNEILKFKAKDLFNDEEDADVCFPAQRLPCRLPLYLRFFFFPF